METSTITPGTVDDVVKAIVSTVPAVDLALNASTDENTGIAQMLTTPDLIEELRHHGGIPENDNTDDMAREIWKQLFVHRTPLSDSCRRVLTLLNKLGFRDSVHTRNLEAMCKEARAMQDGEWKHKIMQLARLQHIVRAIDITHGEEETIPTHAPHALVVPPRAPRRPRRPCAARPGGRGGGGAPPTHHVRVAPATGRRSRGKKRPPPARAPCGSC